MAAEHEAPERAAEEIAQLLYHRRCSCSPAASPSTTSTRGCEADPMLRIAVPNKGSLAEPAGADAARGRLPAAVRPARAGAAGPGQRHRVLLPAPARHRGVRRLRHSSTSASPGATCCSTAAPPPTRSCRSASPRRPSGSRPGRARPPTSPTSPGCGSPPPTPAWSSATSPSTASPAEVIRLDGAVETAVRLGVADVIADVVRPGPRCARPVWRSSASRSCESEAVLVRRRGRASRRRPSTSWSAGCRASSSRGTYVLMDYDIPVELRRGRPCG